MKYPEKYTFPAILTYEPYKINVSFPDLPGCIAYGITEGEALHNGREALGIHLCAIEMADNEIPTPSKLRDVKHDADDVVLLIDVMMAPVRMIQVNRCVTRSVTLPAWLNAAAAAAGINFSQALQDTLIERFGLKRPNL